MSLKKIKGPTAGTRHKISIKKNLLVKNNKILKTLLFKKHTISGRSSITGRITVFHRGSGCKRLYRKINFLNSISKSVIVGVFYDPNRSAFIALNFDLLKKTFYNTIAIECAYPGSLIDCQKKLNEFRIGYRTLLTKIPSGAPINNISLSENSYAQYGRAAGTECILLQKSYLNSHIRLPSGKIIELSTAAFASVGKVTNKLHGQTYLGKAGTNRLRGKRPIVRGIAMNPVDHPHGGRTNGGMHWVTPWGIPTKGHHTKHKNR